MMEDNFEKYLNILTEELSILSDKNEETPLNTLRALWLSAAGISVSALTSESHQLPELTISENQNLEELIRKRLDNVPLAHLTGKQSFLGMEFHTGPEALIPRKETELLALTAVKILRDIDAQKINVIDVGTGAGNVAISIADAILNSKVYATDISAGAIKLAKKNAKLHDVSSQLSFYCGDLLKPLNKIGLEGKVELICCNPPYISSSKVSHMPSEICAYEPGEAFDGGPFGVNLVCRLITDAEKLLCHNGCLTLEIGLGQGSVVQKFLNKTGFYHNTKMINDDSGNPRVLVAHKI